MSGQPQSSILQRLHWRAILIGFAVDYGGSITFGIVSGIVIGVLHGARGGDPGGAAFELLKSPSYMVTGLIVGSLFVVVGGLIVGRIAHRARVLNGAALGVIDVLVGLTYYGQLPFWYHAISMVVTIPCALLGAWLSGLFFPRNDPPPPIPPQS